MNLQTSLKVGFLSCMLLLSMQTTYAENETTSTTVPASYVPTSEEDAKITNTLKSTIKDSSILSKFDIEVTTEKGVVTLNGTVDSDSQATALVEHAEMIIGVKDVNTSGLKVKDGKQPFADMMITAKVVGILVREHIFGEKDVGSMSTNIETKDGVVYITGRVESQQQIDNAIELIKKSVPEVKKVEYQVKKMTPN